MKLLRMYREISKAWRTLVKTGSPEIKKRAILWRRGPTLVRLERPTRLDRARALGYRAKEGVAVVRIRVSRGGMRKKRPVSGRRPKHMGVLKIKSNVPAQAVAERRVSERYVNMKVIGSYLVWKDGRYAWFECVLIDPKQPAIANDYTYRRALGVVR